MQLLQLLRPWRVATIATIASFFLWPGPPAEVCTNPTCPAHKHREPPLVPLSPAAPDPPHDQANGGPLIAPLMPTPQNSQTSCDVHLLRSVHPTPPAHCCAGVVSTNLPVELTCGPIAGPSVPSVADGHSFTCHSLRQGRGGAWGCGIGGVSVGWRAEVGAGAGKGKLGILPRFATFGRA